MDTETAEKARCLPESEMQVALLGSAKAAKGYQVRQAATALAPTSNDGASTIEASQPYTVAVTITGVSPILFHRWSVEAVQQKADAAKGSKAKKTDNIESYVWRNSDGYLCLPGEYLRGAIIAAAKFRQDPRSPRKSAQDLFKAAIFALEDLAPIRNSNGDVCMHWDFIDQRRVTVQRNGITRQRPAMLAGWTTDLLLMCNLPEYIPSQMLNEVVQAAGRLVGVGDFRPTYGRFVVTRFVAH